MGRMAFMKNENIFETDAEKELLTIEDELRRLRSHMLSVEKQFAPLKIGLHKDQAESASNFLHYMAMRDRDLRPLQDRLAQHGLSSLGRSESHVLDNVDAVLNVIGRLFGRSDGASTDVIDRQFATGRFRLAENTLNLLGPTPAGRDVRIMVTMPTEAGTDYELVRDLLKAGMDCMRINCAHDDEAGWERMIGNLAQARNDLGKPCLLLMDIPGPKLRTGPIEPLPGVIKWQPRRNRFGVVIAPARIWLRPNNSGLAQAVKASDARLNLPTNWLAKLNPGDHVWFFDMRGHRGSLIITEVFAEGCLAESKKTSYIADGTLFQIVRQQSETVTPMDTAVVSAVPAEPQAIPLRSGDTLIVTGDLKAGRPAIRHADGTVFEPARISISLPQILSDLRPGETIWFDDGKIGGEILSAHDHSVAVRITKCRVQGAKLRADKGINLPDSDLSLPALTDEDISLLPFIARHADLVGYSFVRSGNDVRLLQEHLHRAGGQHLGLILKIETRRAVEQLPQLLLAAMRSPVAGVMIARGDLAVECGYERTGELQEEIMWLAEAAHMPVIWATQVLETMAKTGQPSRAEITDAAMAERAECVMLNKGPYIVETVIRLANILQRMQAHQTKKTSLLRPLSIAARFCEGNF